jgi:2-haloacid dehalogenase
MNDAGLDRVMKAYLFADCVRDVEPALESLNRVPLVILSSASLKMLEPAVRHNGLESSFTDLISVDRARIYKPTPRAYYLATESL